MDTPACGLYRDGVRSCTNTLVTVAPSAGLGPATDPVYETGALSTELRGLAVGGVGYQPASPRVSPGAVSAKSSGTGVSHVMVPDPSEDWPVVLREVASPCS